MIPYPHNNSYYGPFKNVEIMEIDSGGCYFQAIVMGEPSRETNGKITANVRFRNKKTVFAATFGSHYEEALTLRRGDEVWVCPYEHDALDRIDRHCALVRWYLRNFG